MGKWGARWKEMIFVEKLGDFRCYLLNPAENTGYKYDYSLNYIRPYPDPSQFIKENDFIQLDEYRKAAAKLDNKNKLSVQFNNNNELIGSEVGND